MLKKAMEMGKSLHKGPAGERGGTFLSWGLREKGKISFIRKNVYGGIERHVKEGSGNGQISP
jgi:hypothetical protein